jgi:hypothetical protein
MEAGGAEILRGSPCADSPARAAAARMVTERKECSLVLTGFQKESLYVPGNSDANYVEPQLWHDSARPSGTGFHAVTRIAPATSVGLMLPTIARHAGPAMTISLLLSTIVCLSMGGTVYVRLQRFYCQSALRRALARPSRGEIGICTSQLGEQNLLPAVLAAAIPDSSSLK